MNVTFLWQLSSKGGHLPIEVVSQGDCLPLSNSPISELEVGYIHPSHVVLGISAQQFHVEMETFGLKNLSKEEYHS